MITYYSGAREMLTFKGWAQRLADAATTDNEMFHKLIVAFWNGEFPYDDVWWDAHTYFEETFDDIDDSIKPDFAKLESIKGPRWEILENMIVGGHESLANEAMSQLGPGELIVTQPESEYRVREIMGTEENTETAGSTFTLDIPDTNVHPDDSDGAAAFGWLAHRFLHKYSDQDRFILGLIAVTAGSIEKWRGIADQEDATPVKQPKSTRKDYVSVDKKLAARVRRIGREKVLAQSVRSLAGNVTDLMRSDADIDNHNIPGERSMRDYVSAWQKRETPTA